jgi:outer membrane receptor for ferrienterochelin and colicins
LFTIAARAFMKIVWRRCALGEKHRGGDEIYGESIYTKRAECGSYQLPFQEKLMLSFSGNVHFQDSRYGTTSYIANQKIGFLQLTWDKKKEIMTTFRNCHRYNYYDDNTPATSKLRNNNPETWLPNFFYSRRNYIHRKTKAITGNALRLQLDSRKHLNAKNCLQMELNEISFV